ncbi:MAG: MFS transporter, partial [Acidobacteria bacterium]|nr:MFS transporter [Acidobacteriota bacterium]
MTDIHLTAAASKVRRRLVPFLFLCYIFAYLDRINVGFAALQMNAALGFSTEVYGFGAGIFFLSYTAFEIPSNIILARVGARRWIARIMITWGVISAGMMLVRDAPTFYGMR